MSRFNWYDSYSPLHVEPNNTSWNFGKIFLTITSLICIVTLQFQAYYSPGFKVFLNLIWYPGINIGLTTLAFGIGYDYFTPYKIRWKIWMRQHSNFYCSYYFYAFLIIVVGWISFGIASSSNDAFFSGTDSIGLMTNNGLANSNYGWTNDVNLRYLFIVIYSLIPLQNFFILGTVFVVTWFFFIFFAPFIFNKMNKMNFRSNSLIIIFLLIISWFLSMWGQVFSYSGSLRGQIPWYQYMTQYSGWIIILSFFLTGFYIRKYLEIIPWKIALLAFSILALVFFGVETGLDYHFDNFNNFYLGAGIASAPILILSFLALNIFTGFTTKKQKKSKFVLGINQFFEYSQYYITDQFLLMGIATRMILGVLIMHYIAGVDIQIINNQNISVAPTNITNIADKNAWGWYLICFFVFISIFIYFITWIKKIFFEFITKKFKFNYQLTREKDV